MTTPQKALRLAHTALVIGLLAHSNIVSAQAHPIAFGETVRGTFRDSHDMREYTVTMKDGDCLLIDIGSRGTTLITNVKVLDPAGTQVQYWGSANTHRHQSQPLSAEGPHRIQVRNTRGVGVYTISADRIGACPVSNR